MLAQPVFQTVPHQLNFQPLQRATSVDECCLKIQRLIRQMIRRDHGFYRIEVEELKEALATRFIDENKDSPQLIEAFSLLLQTNARLFSIPTTSS